jgi:DtxR family Mn-dependent transcriptional regulator
MPHANASNAHELNVTVPDTQHHPAVEEYLETIFHLEEAGVPAMRARLVERLGVSAPAVSEQIKRLEREGYVHLSEERTIAFTAEGRNYATSIVRRHRLAECLLVDMLGLPWHQVHVEAGLLEHAISPVLEERLVAVLGDPVTCPHGNPIPGSNKPYAPGPMRSLGTLKVGEKSTLIRLEEDLQANHETLKTLESAGAVPGAEVKIEVNDGSVLRFLAPKGVVELSIDASAGIRIAR